MYTIREKGRNGSLEITSDSLVRVIHEKEPPNFWTKRRVHDKHKVIPLESVTHVMYRPNRLRTDVVTISTPDKTWKWKVVHAAEFVTELNDAVASLQNA